MAKVVKKKKKLGGRAATGGTSGKKVTPLRPYIDPKTPPCQPGCPIGNDPRGALAYVATSDKCDRTYEESFEHAFHIFANTNPFPAITGRLCTACCEHECNRQYKDGAVNINKFERYLGDYAIENKLKLTKLTEERREGKIAIVGSGPAGLSCAYQLARRGWQVTVFEAMDRPGGLLRYVAPFRLPRQVLDAEVQRILDLGVKLKTGVVVGKDISFAQLEIEYKAVFVAVGAHRERKVDGAWKAQNVLTGIDFMARLNAGDRPDIGDDVVVLGGGDGALDVARACRRLGANTTIVYRRTKEDMSALPYDVVNAEAEGVHFEFLTGPMELIKEGDRAAKLKCQRLKLGAPDGSGRRRPVPLNGQVFERPFTTLILGQIQEPDFADPLSRVGINGRAATGSKLKTAMSGLFAGSEANRLGHVTVAIAQGRQAAEEIAAELNPDEKKAETPPVIYKDKIKIAFYDAADRHVEAVRPVAERLEGAGAMTAEANMGLSRDDAIAEAKRCFSCGMCMDCDTCWMYCQDQAIDKLAKTLPVGKHYEYKHSLCTGCEKCAEECPCGYLKMV